MSAVRRVAVPPDARALTTLTRIDYEDAFALETSAAQDRTAEQWARAVLEDAPAAFRGSLRRGWFVLGLQLGPSRTEGFVFGWELLSAAPDVALLAVRSRIGLRAELVFKREQRRLVLASFVQEQTRLARAATAAVAPVHRRAVRYLLTQAGKRSAERFGGPVPVSPPAG
jgi:hypothetical protein